MLWRTFTVPEATLLCIRLRFWETAEAYDAKKKGSLRTTTHLPNGHR